MAENRIGRTCVEHIFKQPGRWVVVACQSRSLSWQWRRLFINLSEITQNRGHRPEPWMEEARLRPVGDMWDLVGQLPDRTAPAHSCHCAASRMVGSDQVRWYPECGQGLSSVNSG